jgi:hypothetical protein
MAVDFNKELGNRHAGHEPTSDRRAVDMVPAGLQRPLAAST